MTSLDKGMSPAVDDLRINVSELRKQLGSTVGVPVSVELEKVRVVDSEASGPVTGNLVVEAIDGGARVAGELTFVWKASCRRCLEDIISDQATSVDETFQQGAEPDSEIHDFDGVHIDLLPLVTEAIAFSLPLAPLCKDSCAGPAPDSFPALTGEQLADSPSIDPRWDALKDLKFD
jgi:uncharacterized protein